MLARIITLTAALVLATTVASQGQDDKTKTTVRHLPNPKGLPFSVGGGKAVQVLDSIQALEKLAGAKAGAELAKHVDFTKEHVLFVSWGTSGPPFGSLEFNVKTADKKSLVEFHIKEPKAERRGQAFKLGADFFAVPKGVIGRLVGSK